MLGDLKPDIESGLTQTPQAKQLSFCQYQIFANILHQLIHTTWSQTKKYLVFQSMSSNSPAYSLLISYSPCALRKTAKIL